MQAFRQQPGLAGAGGKFGQAPAQLLDLPGEFGLTRPVLQGGQAAGDRLDLLARGGDLVGTHLGLDLGIDRGLDLLGQLGARDPHPLDRLGALGRGPGLGGMGWTASAQFGEAAGGAQDLVADRLEVGEPAFAQGAMGEGELGAQGRHIDPGLGQGGDAFLDGFDAFARSAEVEFAHGPSLAPG